MKLTLREHLLLFLTALISLTLFSKNSPLYPINDWNDANTIFTVGKGILFGKMPYRDLIDHKGPLLFLLNGMASLVSTAHLWGLYLLEVVASYFFFLFSYRSVSLFTQSPLRIWLIPMTAFLLYTGRWMNRGGSAEELCLPLLAYPLYLTLRALKTGREIAFGEHLLTGICIGAVFSIKFNLLGFHGANYLYWAYTYLAARRWRDFRRMTVAYSLGALLVILPLVGWFFYEGALWHLYDVYIDGNLFSYVNSPTRLPNWLGAILRIRIGLTYDYLTAALMTAGAIALFVRERRIALFLAWGCLLLCIGCFNRIIFTYYAMVLGVFLPLTLCFLAIECARRLPSSLRPPLLAVVTVTICAIGFARDLKRPSLLGSIDDTPFPEMASIVRQVPDAKFIYYNCEDCGLLNYMDRLPQFDHFSLIRLRPDEVLAVQRAWLDAGKADFYMCDEPAPWRGYELVYHRKVEPDAWNNRGYMSYYLYRRKDLGGK